MTAPDELTPDALAAIEARAAAATPGPWHADHDFGHVNAAALGPSHVVCALDSELCIDTGGADISFIAHARTDVPALVAEVRRLRAAGDEAVRAAVAAETLRCIEACQHVASQCAEQDDRDLALTCAEAIEVDAPQAPATGGA